MSLFTKVLLIDDDEIVNTINEMILKHSDLADEVVIKASTEDGLNYYFSQEGDAAPDVVFVDVNMPEKNGWDFVEAFEANFKSDLISKRIVMLSASINPEDGEKAAEHPSITKFLSKPLSPEVVKELHEEFFA